ncbi:MAG: hypothetical protein CEN91_15 [Candidatus Berkelbacteria bacterium Licking1014_85]|uniref:Uncharacterized protein n=1 Tax=Candidatus Berkelbacteria bacterium Licking1014_85 TaxID=2017148 RepID=A0A554LN26_9BACT|nr:MAG: hypothetical protein CEN91_15 [Candidatus Berkelbacteria bacterium Licking1014_85]
MEGLNKLGNDIDPMTGDFINSAEKKQDVELPSKIGNLPPLQEGYIRYVHITNERAANNIANNGLDYENQGMLSSTARGWSNEADVEYCTDDPRFSFLGAKAVVLDIPEQEARIHDNVQKSPGFVPNKYVVGIIDIQPK